MQFLSFCSTDTSNSIISSSIVVCVGSLESIEPLSEFHEDQMGFLSDALTFLRCAATVIKAKVAEWTTLVSIKSQKPCFSSTFLFKPLKEQLRIPIKLS